MVQFVDFLFLRTEDTSPREPLVDIVRDFRE